MKFKNILGNLSEILYFFVWSYIQLFGVYHGILKHNWTISVFVPPVAWYYSIEYWWHYDKIEVLADMKSCLYLLHLDQQNNGQEYKVEMFKFHKRYNDYSSEEKKDIKNFVFDYLKYREFQFVDFKDAFDNYLITHKLTFIISDRTNERKIKFSKHELGNKILKEEKNDFENFSNIYIKQLSEVSNENLDSTILEIKRMEYREQERLKSVYKEIFSEEYKENIEYY